MAEILAIILCFIVGFVCGGTCIYLAFDDELKSGKVISGKRVYKAERVI